MIKLDKELATKIKELFDERDAFQGTIELLSSKAQFKERAAFDIIREKLPSYPPLESGGYSLLWKDGFLFVYAEEKVDIDALANKIFDDALKEVEKKVK